MLTADAASLFLASRVSKGLSPQTVRWYKGILTRFQEMWPDLPTGPESIELFLAKCTAKDERRHGYFRALRAFYKFLNRRYKIPNPIEEGFVDAPKRAKKDPHNLTYWELYTLLSHTHLPVVSACLAFVADTGCRLGELHSLEPGDFIQTPLGYVAKVTGKTGARLVPVTRSAAEALIPHLPLKMSPWWLCRLMSRGFEEAGIKGSTHTLRHTFATLWEGDEFALQRIMGHAKIETTRIYRNLKTDRLSIQHNQFSPVARLPVGAQQIAMI